MKTPWALLFILVVTEGVSFDNFMLEQWKLFKLQFNKRYTYEKEESIRLKIFNYNRNKIIKHNFRYEAGLVTFSLAMNHFGDMLLHEFVSTMNGFNTSNDTVNRLVSGVTPSYYVEPLNVKLAKSVDWRSVGAVTPVKDQGHCGSCWAFSVTGSLEGQHFRKTGKLVSLSEQNLIDCSCKYGNNGCNGGYVDKTFQYIKENHGIDIEDEYPYEAKDNQCRYRPDVSGATDSGFVDLPYGDERKLMAAVATIGPVSVIIDANHHSFQFYSKGIYYEPRCSVTELDHAVLAVGYGTTENGLDYWLIKNSWGKQWGDQGYIKMIRNKHNNCGIATSASYPLV